MIIFEKIRWKNFLSTGNSFTELSLNTSPSSLIVGNNGAGKSTLLDALCFGLFNKPFRKINKPQLVNSVNERDALVEIEFSIGSVTYKVERGIKPNIFRIYRNGSLLDQDAANKDYQKYLEQSILKFNYKSFTQVVILGSSTFVPFMQLPAAHRREVIEDLLDIQIFSQMNSILKDRVKDLKETVRNCQYEVKIAEQAVNHQRSSMQSLSKINAEHIKSLQSKFDANELRQMDILKRVKSNEQCISDLALKLANQSTLQAKNDKLRDMRAKIEQNLSKANKDFAFYNDNDSCPTCHQSLDDEHKTKHMENATERKEKFNKGFADIDAAVTDIAATLEEMRGYGQSITSYQHEILSLTKENDKLQRENVVLMEEVNKPTPNIDQQQKLLVESEDNYNSVAQRCSEINKDFSNMQVVGGLLKDSGIKSKVISKFVPVINKQINKYLQSMDFFVNFTLDEEFNEVIKSRFRDVFSYASFSEGEKQKIDLGLLFCWRDIAKMKNSASTNLLILDEVFDSSLDSTATDELMKILKGLDKRTNLFVISHKGEILVDRFDTNIEFEKVGDFSKVKADESNSNC
jgi:DNA repair exonuclease SbcCD ATPase subunit